MKRFAFENIKVVDFSWVGVGPITAKYLADHGAEVIRIDSSVRPDVLRLAPPWKDKKPGINRSQFYANYNSSKYGISLDLGKPQAREIAKKLIARADVVTESFTPRVMKGWGLDYEELRKIKPDLIMLSTCQQGQTGPHALYRGYGQLMAALAGFYSVTGWPDGDPVPIYGAYTDFISPRFAATALIAALDYKRRTGKGQYIDLSQFEASLHFLAPPLLDYMVNGRIMKRRGNHSENAAPHGAYLCLGDDRWCVIAVSTDEEWKAFCQVIGNPEWTHDPKFATLQGRLEHVEELDRLVETWTQNYPPEEVMALMQAAGVPVGVVQSCEDLHHDPQLKHRNFFVWLNHTEVGMSPYDGLQFILSRTPGELRMPAPCIGEHNDYVFKQILGMSDEEVQRLIEEEVIN
ncbi:MAG: CoA transferase [Candidatus Tectomicrobia bacterium]|nr:CoA transferase [Candidatus Tectomicrobia bacterium]